MVVHSGGCQCGGVRYRVTGVLGHPHICHCRLCQKAAGTCFLPFAGAMLTDFSMTRTEPTWFQSSDLARHGFCTRCGTPLFYTVPGADVINPKDFLHEH